MAEKSETRAGGCLCGAVRFEARGAPLWVAHCHCTSCRRTTASPFTTYAGYRPDDVAFLSGRPKTYRSSPGVTRGFCPDCGTSISFESERWPDEIHLFVGTFDDPGDVTPEAHVFTAESVPWLRLADHLPRHQATSSDSTE